MENPYRGFAPVCICGLSIAPCFRNCKRRRGNFLHFGRLDKILRRNWAKWRKIRALSRPWPPLGGGCRRSRLGERNPYGVSPSVALRATPPSQREANGRGRAPPLWKTPPRGWGAGNGLPRQCEHWLAMTPLRGVSLPPSAQSADTSLAEGGKREGQSPSPTRGFTKAWTKIGSPSQREDSFSQF